MKFVLLVCLGNICRSPLAHGIFQHLVNQNGLDWHIDSAGTGDWHIGKLPDPRSVSEAKRNGIDITYQRARQFQVDDFNNFDHIFVMDEDNYLNVSDLARNQTDLDKVQLIIPGQEVPDPYFGGDEGFQQVFSMLHDRISVLLNQL